MECLIFHPQDLVDQPYQYNGVEYLDQAGLDVNLATWRTLDPCIGRWWSVDPKAEALFSYTPYNSMADNPIGVTDPEGDIIAPLILNLAGSVLANGLSNINQGNGFFNGVGGALIRGAVSAGLSYGIGSAFGPTGSLGHELLRGGAHAISGGLQSEFFGGSFLQGAFSGGLSSGIGSGIDALGGGALGQILGGGLGGGLGSAISGEDVFWGVHQGLMVGAFNHAMHGAFQGGPGTPAWDLDGDGRLSLSEANEWYRNGRGRTITVNASSVDLDFIDPNNWPIGKSDYVQTLFSSRDGRIYGNIKITSLGNNRFSINQDEYGFEMHKGESFKTQIRNISTRIGSILAGTGTPYKINFSGVNTVNHRIFNPNFIMGHKGF